MKTSEHVEQSQSSTENHHLTASVQRQLDAILHNRKLQIVLPGEPLDFNKKNTPGLLQLLKDVGRASLSVGRIYEGHINALLLIHSFGTEEQKQQWFADAEDGCVFGVWNTQGATEGIEFIQQDEDTFLLQGKKTFASGAGVINKVIVTGNANYKGASGWQMCVIDTGRLPQDAIDYSSWQPLGMQESLSYTIDLWGYELSSNELLGNLHSYYQQPYFGAGAIRFCAVQLGGAESLFNDAVQYLKTLNRTDDPFQKERIANMAAALTSGQLWLQQAGANWDCWSKDETKTKRLLAFANATRMTIEKICLDVIEGISKCVGARGLQHPYPLEKTMRDLQFYLRQPAPDAAMIDVANYVIQSDKPIETLWHDNR